MHKLLVGQCLAVTTALSVGIAGVAFAQRVPSVQTNVEADRLTITVEDAWPLERAAYEIQRLCGCPVSFENPPIRNLGDLVDDTGRPGAAGSYRALRPRPARLEFRFPVTLPLDNDAAVALVHQMVDQYERLGLPGRFRVDVSHGIVQVVPTASRNEAGQLEGIDPVLSAIVSLSEADRSVDQAVRGIVAAAAAQSGRPISVVSAPLQLFLQHRTTTVIDGVPARVALGRVLESLPHRVSWRLRYRPGADDYTISFDAVPAAPAR